MISAIIVDDEKANRSSLKKLLRENCPMIQVIDEAGSTSEAFHLIRLNSPQLVFLDIELSERSAFDLLNMFDEVNFKIIFVTAHSHYAIKAIKFSAIDFLLKPVEASDLIASTKKAIREINYNHQVQYKGLVENMQSEKVHKLAVPIQNGLVFLSTDEIIRLEADVNYTYIFSLSEKYTAAKGIKDYEQLLNDYNFFRIHKSHLINLKHVKQFSRTDGYFVQMSDGSNVEISRRKKDEFVEAMSLR